MVYVGGHRESDTAERGAASGATGSVSQRRGPGHDPAPSRRDRDPQASTSESDSRPTGFDHEQSGRLEEQIRLSDLQQLQATFSSHRSSRHSEDEDDDDAAEAEGASTGTQGSRVSARA
ncbi:uncharacterized protein LOC144949171 [Lampetra fluviatilis]